MKQARSSKSFGDRINFHPYLHFQVTEGGLDAAGVFLLFLRIDDARLAGYFFGKVLSFLVGRELLNPEWAHRILSWPHTSINVHSLVRSKAKLEADWAGKYLIRPLLTLERLSFLEPAGKVGYRHVDKADDLETMDYLELIARATSHILRRSPAGSGCLSD